MKKKLGLFSNEEQDQSLIEQLLKMMEKYKADYTNTFRSLTLDAIENTALFESPEFKEWYKMWQSRLERQEQSKENAYEMMKNNNPSIIPRNHRVEEALEAAVTNEDYSVMEQLLEALSNPYAYSTDQEEYCIPPAPTNRPYRTFVGLDCLICKRCVHIICVNAPFYIPHSTKTLKYTSPMPFL